MNAKSVFESVQPRSESNETCLGFPEKKKKHRTVSAVIRSPRDTLEVKKELEGFAKGRKINRRISFFPSEPTLPRKTYLNERVVCSTECHPAASTKHRREQINTGPD